MEILMGTPASLGADLMARMARYRHGVFIERLRWPLEAPGGLELDQFDRPDTVYLLARHPDGALAGTARLLSTDRPCLLSEVFPELMGQAALPRSRDIWELSRFAAIDLAPRPAGAEHRPALPVAVMLLRAALETAASAGVRRLITVSPVGVERLLYRYGFDASRVAEPRPIHGQSVVACWIEVAPTQAS